MRKTKIDLTTGVSESFPVVREPKSFDNANIKEVKFHGQTLLVTRDGAVGRPGDVRSLKQYQCRIEYIIVRLKIKEYTASVRALPARLHVLVARAYCENYGPDMVVNHIDENKGNNEATNLEWITQQENVAHSLGLPREQYRNGALVKTFNSVKLLARELKLTPSILDPAIVLGEKIDSHTYTFQGYKPATEWRNTSRSLRPMRSRGSLLLAPR